MDLTAKQLEFRRRKENVDRIEEAILLMEKDIKRNIKKLGFANNDVEIELIEKEIEIYTRLLSGLVIIWSENMIKWLLYEHGAFYNEQIQGLLSRSELKQKWTGALNAAFFDFYAGLTYDPNNPLPRKNSIINSTLIREKDKKRYNKIYELIRKNLGDSIKIRNKIQHGDWVHSYSKSDTTKEYEIDSILTSSVTNENILKLRLKRKQFKLLYHLIRDLAVFRKKGKFKLDNNSSPFSYFFGKRYGEILNLQKTIDNFNFENYKNELIERHVRGGDWKERNTNTQIQTDIIPVV